MKARRAQLLAEFRKNATEVVRLHLHSFFLGAFVDVQIWRAERLGGKAVDAHPTREGLFLAAELLPKLRQAVEKAIAMALSGEKEKTGL